jgi:hypothetical protein
LPGRLAGGSASPRVHTGRQLFFKRVELKDNTVFYDGGFFMKTDAELYDEIAQMPEAAALARVNEIRADRGLSPVNKLCGAILSRKAIRIGDAANAAHSGVRLDKM